MKVIFYDEFPRAERRFHLDYESRVSERIALRFQDEVDTAVKAIKSAPLSAGHFIHLDLEMGLKFRRRNFRKFPFFILYMFDGNWLVFASILPSHSDPKNWLRGIDIP